MPAKQPKSLLENLLEQALVFKYFYIECLILYYHNLNKILKME